MAIYLNDANNSYIQAGELSGRALPATIYIHGRFVSGINNQYMGGYYTGAFPNLRGMTVTGHGGDASKYVSSLATTSTNQSSLSTITADQQWRTYIIAAPTSGNYTYKVDNETPVSTAFTGDWSTNAPSFLCVGDGPGWLGTYTQGNSEHYAMALWSIALSTAEQSQLAKTKYPPMVRPDKLVMFYPFEGNEMNQGKWGSVTATLNGVKSQVAAPIRKRKI